MKNKRPRYSKVVRALQALGSPKKAKTSSYFFKTKKGQYGYGDVFIGVTVPEQRRVAHAYRELPFPELSKLLKSRIHECRLTALFILYLQFIRAKEADRKKIVDFYLTHIAYINNWDLVDSSAPSILGNYLIDKDKKIIYKLAKSKNIWERRIAIITTAMFIKNHAYDDTLNIAEMLLTDPHDLIHKAVGWMLREVGNRSLETEEKFLKKHARRMPRTMLRYAIEKFPEKKRKKYLVG